MESIRNIKEKIKSCVSCTEDLCPFMKERLDRHMLTHNSNSNRESSQSHKYRKSSGMDTLNSMLTMTSIDEQTSTTDLREKRIEKSPKEMESKYRRRLKEIIFEWAKNLPRYSNASAENVKENIVNDLIEKVNKMYPEIKEDYYDMNLSMEIDKFVDSLPMLSNLLEDKRYMDPLKETLAEKIHQLNNSFMNIHSTEKQENETKFKDEATNTQQGYTKIENFDVGQSFTKIKPYYRDIINEPNVNKHQNSDVKNNTYREIIYNWIGDFCRNLDKNQKRIITDALTNRLKELLHSKTTINYKLILKAEIFNFLNDYADKLLLSPENYTKLNRLSEKLAVKLLSAKFSHEEVYSMSYSSSYKNSSDDMTTFSYVQEDPFQYLVQEIVCEQLQKNNISKAVARDIVNIILKNIKFICMHQDYCIEIHIFNILKICTELSDYNISTLTSNILDQIRAKATSKYLTTYNSLYFNDNINTCGTSFISIYKSENEIRGPNTSQSSSKRKIYENSSQHLTMDEKKYVNSISQILRAWVKKLPIEGKKFDKKKNEEIVINNLAYDILDQIKLEQIVPETRAEKDIFLSFFINRWLNKLNWFHNIADAQPYVGNLVEELKKIYPPILSKTNHKQHTKKKETSPGNNDLSHLNQSLDRKEVSNNQPIKVQAILKEFILKYIEHNYDEDNALTREVFGNILKKELQKLSTPSRQEVYKNFNNKEVNSLDSDNLSKELQLINIISDWLKILPVEDSFNVAGNEDRAQFVNNLAKSINEMEESNSQSDDYKHKLKSRILQFTEGLPINDAYTQDMPVFVDNLIRNIYALQSPLQCCAYANDKDLSLNISSIPHHNISDFIQEYIRENSEVIEDDELKLDAWSLRIFKEVDNMARDNPPTLSTSQVYSRMSEISQQGEDLGQRFNFELSCAKELCNWLNNLPLQTNMDTKDIIVAMISNLAEKMSERWQIKSVDSNNSQVDDKLKNYIKTWITELPLDPTKEIVLPVVIQQIWNRMERVTKSKDSPSSVIQQKFSENSSSICESPYPCCKRNPVTKDFEKRDPGTEIVEAIEVWCNNLPIHADNDLLENTLKEEFSTKLYKKISELNKNPDCFNNNILYLQLLEEEIDSGLNGLPQNAQLQHSREILKRQILNKVNENRNVMREKAAGVKYRQELDKTIEMSLPNPIFYQQKDCPGFIIYKSLLAQLFILEYFDHAHDDFKINCIRKIRNKIDYHFKNVENINAVSLTKDQLFKQLYSALFSVPVPKENSIIGEVEEIKTRCVIEVWFESLPLREASLVEELLEREQIISMLAKRIHAFEKNDQNPNDKIHKEIRKWLMKLPILPGYENVDILANSLLHGLILSENDRKCQPYDSNVTLENFLLNKNNNKGILGTTQVAGPSSEGKLWFSPTSSSSPKLRQSCCKKGGKPSDLLLEIIEKWCQQLPLPDNSQQEKENSKTIRDNLVVRMIIKISELNLNLEAFDNDLLYDSLLDDEIEDLMSTLPTSVELLRNKNSLKQQFKDSIKSIKPLIKEEKARYEYKQDLKNTADQVLGQPQNVLSVKVALLRTLRDEIVDDFIVYNFSKGDENREVYRVMLQSVVERYIVEKGSMSNDSESDPLTKENQLMNELAKVPAPSDDAILEEVNEILMKFEVNVFFKELPIADDENKQPLQSQVKYTLAKRLSDIKKDGFQNNHEKVKKEIIKCLHKIQNEIDPQKVDTFIKRLETTENSNFPQIASSSNQNIRSPNDNVWRNDINMSNNNQNGSQPIVSNEDQQWMSLLPVTPGGNVLSYRDTIQSNYTKNLDEAASPQRRGFGRSLNQSGSSYEQFKGGEMLTSSVIRKNETVQNLPHSNGQVKNLSQNQNLSTSCGTKRDTPNEDSIQQKGLGADLQPPTLSIKQKSSSSFAQQADLPRVQSRSYQPLSNQSSQSKQIANGCCKNQRCPNPQRNQFNSLPPSQFTSENRDLIQQQPYRPSMIERTSSKRNFDNISIRSLPPDASPQFSQNSSYLNSRCNRNCRRPSIILLSPPFTDSNNLEIKNENKPQDNTCSITDDEESNCSCNKRRKQCNGPVCHNHLRRQCRVCNRPNSFRCMAPYRRYY